MQPSSIIRFTCGALALAVTAITPLLAQERQAVALASAKVTLAGTSNLHDYTATTTSVRLTRLQVASGADLAALTTPGTLRTRSTTAW